MMMETEGMEESMSSAQVERVMATDAGPGDASAVAATSPLLQRIATLSRTIKETREEEKLDEQRAGEFLIITKQSRRAGGPLLMRLIKTSPRARTSTLSLALLLTSMPTPPVPVPGPSPYP